ncbi:MAG: amino acid racemase [Allosphingosinicella sp.]
MVFSTALYYEQINKAVAKAKGGPSSAPLVLESLDLARVAALELAGRWDEVGQIAAAAAARLEAAGAKGLILCSNTTHKVAPAVEAAVSIPLIHIADVTADRLAADGVRKAGLIGTRFTMGEGFFRDRIAARGIDLILPDPAVAGEIDRIIFEELARGQVSRNSQRLLKTCVTENGQGPAAGRDPGLHRIGASRRPGRQRHPGLRHHGASRRRRRSLDIGGSLIQIGASPPTVIAAPRD